jgi:uncharacterized membrane protein (TIGR02234 family)
VNRRYPLGPIAAVAIAAVLLWISSRLTWVRVTSADGLGVPHTTRLGGGSWFGALVPLALVLLASVAALFATRGGARQAVGVVIALVGAATAVPALALLGHAKGAAGKARSLADLPGRAVVTALHTATFPPVLTVIGALLAVGAGAWLARRPSAAGLSGKYDKPAARRAEAVQRMSDNSAQMSERVLWDAFDAGEDPTEDR